MSGKPNQPYIPPLHIDVYVHVEGDQLRLDQESVTVESSDQVIRWTTNGRDVNVAFPGENPIRGAIFRRGSGSCELARIPTGNHGRHKYTVTVTTHDGAIVEKDPDVIVNY
ncbi:MAG: hypothetical protein ACYC7A_15505 [Thermoanaerobaculia bacterium]